MIKRIVVAGCRYYKDYIEAEKYIDLCIDNLKKKYTLVFVSGGCSGADFLGEKYDLNNNYFLEIYKAEWSKYGKMAGPLRNKRMAEIGDYFICFWDGKSKGTKNLIENVRIKNKPLRIKYIDC